MENKVAADKFKAIFQHLFGLDWGKATEKHQSK
jgi:hypothetical protein